MMQMFRMLSIVAVAASAAVAVLCGCAEGRVLDDRGLLGLEGKVRRLTFVREDARNGLPPMFADAEGEVGFDTLGRIAYVNDMDFTACGDSIVIAASNGWRGEVAVCRRWQDGAAVCYDGTAGTAGCGAEGRGRFTLRAEFDGEGRLVRIDDEGMLGTLLGLWDWSRSGARTLAYEGEGRLPAGERAVARYGRTVAEGAITYDYLSIDSVGNWTMRVARFAGTGKAAFTERRRLEYWP